MHISDIHRVVLRATRVDILTLRLVVGESRSGYCSVVVLVAHNGVEHSRVAQRCNQRHGIVYVELSGVPHRAVADIAQEDGVYRCRVTRLGYNFACRRYGIALELQQVVVRVVQIEVRHKDYAVVALISLFEVEVVLLGHLTLLAKERPEAWQYSLIALGLITRRRDYEYGVLKLVRSDVVASQRVGLNDMHAVRYGNIGEWLTLAQNSTENGYRITLCRLGLHEEYRGGKHQKKQYLAKA